MNAPWPVIVAVALVLYGLTARSRAGSRPCAFIHERYGRFPASSGPFANLIAYLAHHLDPDFYSRHHRPEALTERPRQLAERSGR